MSDSYISKQQLVQIIDNLSMNYRFCSNTSVGGGGIDIERYLSQYIDDKITEGVRNVLFQLGNEIDMERGGELCLLCKDSNPSEDVQK